MALEGPTCQAPCTLLTICPDSEEETEVPRGCETVPKVPRVGSVGTKVFDSQGCALCMTPNCPQTFVKTKSANHRCESAGPNQQGSQAKGAEFSPHGCDRVTAR